MKKLILLCILISSVNYFAQSVYSQYGIGSLSGTSSVRNAGLGSQGVAILEQDAINTANPATLSQLDFTRVEFSFAANAMFLKDSKQSKYYSQGFFNGFSIGFPVYKPMGISTALGIQPYSTINYEIQSLITNPATGNYNKKYAGSGGISKFYWSTSYLTPYNFQIGLGYNYYFGRSEYATSLTFLNEEFSKGEFSTRYDVSGSGIIAGIVSPDLSEYGMKDYFRSIRLGLTYDYFTKLSTDFEYVAASELIEDTVLTGTGKTEIPAKFTIGVNTQLLNRLGLSFEYTTQAWSKFKRMGAADPSLKDMSKLSFGMSFRHYKESGVDYEKPSYRAGISYTQLPLKVNGKDINEIDLSLGCSIPMGWRNYLETSVTFGMRGTDGSNLIQEKIIRLDASLNFGEIWFIQQDR